jgi:pyruvate,water dikinase
MNLPHQGQQQEPGSTSSDADVVVPLDTLDRTSIPVAGGKAANLGELIKAGFAVPAGFCVTTAAYASVSAHAGLDTYLAGLKATSREERARQIELARAIHTALIETALPPEVVEAIKRA